MYFVGTSLKHYSYLTKYFNIEIRFLACSFVLFEQDQGLQLGSERCFDFTKDKLSGASYFTIHGIRSLFDLFITPGFQGVESQSGTLHNCIHRE